MSGEDEGHALLIGEAGARRFARWDAELYGQVCAGPGKRLWGKIKAQPHALSVFEAYLTLAAEAIGRGYIDRAGFGAMRAGSEGAPNLLALLLLRVIPRQRVEVPAGAQIALFARAWNIGEGLLGESPWLNLYATSALHGLGSLTELEGELVRVLGPALEVRAPAAFRGPFSITTLDVSELDELFLPGEMHLAAPAVLCVHDRKRKGVHAGVFLRPGGKSGFLSLTPCLGEGPSGGDAPEVAFAEGRLSVGKSRLALPLLRHGHRALAAPAGYCVASAVDSQRLWIAETP